MRISDWSSDVCSSDLRDEVLEAGKDAGAADLGVGEGEPEAEAQRIGQEDGQQPHRRQHADEDQERFPVEQPSEPAGRSEERRVGKSGSVRVDLGGGRSINKKK